MGPERRLFESVSISWAESGPTGARRHAIWNKQPYLRRRVIVLKDVRIHVDVVSAPTHQHDPGQEIPIDHAKGGHIVDWITNIDEILIVVTIDQKQSLVLVKLEVHQGRRRVDIAALQHSLAAAVNGVVCATRIHVGVVILQSLSFARFRPDLRCPQRTLLDFHLIRSAPLAGNEQHEG